MPRIAAIKPYIGTIVFALLLGLMLSMRHAGYMLVSVWLVFFCVTPVAVYKAIKHAERRKRLVIKSVVWLVMSVGVILWHVYLDRSVRAKAQQIVDKIEAYHASKGIYPAEISDIGINQADLGKALGFSFYTNKDGYVRLMYATTFILFMMDDYNFQSRTWSRSD